MFQPIHSMHFVLETVIFLYFSKAIKTPDEISMKRKAAALLFLLPPAVLYMENSVIEHVLLRCALRWGCYLCFLLVSKKGPALLCSYYSLLCFVVFTANTNIFQTALLFPVSRGLLPFTGLPLLDAVINSTLEYLFCFAMFFAFTHLVDLNQMSNLQYRRFSVAIAVLACELYVKASLHAITASGSEVLREMSIYTIFLQLILVILLIVYENYLCTRQIQEMTRAQEISARYQAEAYRREIDHSNDTHRLYHDMKNHFLAIRNLCQQEPARAQNYADTLLETFMEIPPPLIETGNTLLNGLIAQKCAGADANKIDVSVIIDARPIAFLSDADLCTIFGNALDNAVEACSNLPCENDRFIQIKGGPLNGQYFLSITNSYNGAVLYSGGRLRTMKNDKAMHGIGLRNISGVVEKYGGVLNIDTSGQQFKLTVMLPLERTEDYK